MEPCTALGLKTPVREHYSPLMGPMEQMHPTKKVWKHIHPTDNSCVLSLQCGVSCVLSLL